MSRNLSSDFVCMVTFWEVTKTRNKMEQDELFHSVLFCIVRPEAGLYLSLNPKSFDLGIPNPKLKLFVNKQKITDHSVCCCYGYL